MDIEFSEDDLARLESDPAFNAGYGVPVVRGYRKVVRFIRAASDERDFRAMRSLNFEKLQGDRDHQYSLRINDQWRLIVEIKKDEPKNVVVIRGIEDYH
ncbi:MAG: type II toxin-antitoxin system RelE/ParE family toxin [Planctomycetes bacterium]|nr:type II toxin-antitoxin system RelE/ParE family toxin [Planctomycetota bacterium]